MSRSNLPVKAGDTTVERVAARLEALELCEVARAAFENASESAIRQYGREVAVVAALCVAGRRSKHRKVDLEFACERLGLEPSSVAHAVELLEGELSPPASDSEIRSLRQSVLAVQELLAGIENDRVNTPRLSGAAFDGVDPTLTSLADQPLGTLDEEVLEAHYRRLEADLEMARLGVELSVLVHGET